MYECNLSSLLACALQDVAKRIGATTARVYMREMIAVECILREKKLLFQDSPRLTLAITWPRRLGGVDREHAVEAQVNGDVRPGYLVLHGPASVSASPCRVEDHTAPPTDQRWA